MILPSNYDEIDFDALYKAQKARSSFAKNLPRIGTKRRQALTRA